jgi:hypothetical protein
MKNIILTLLFVVMSLSINSQILQTEASTTAGSSSMAFIDGSSAFNYNAFNGAGKGILFPSTDLTNINAADVFDSGTVGTSTYNPNYYDGLVVYNTGTGSVIGEMGTGSPDVAPGFYYYANPNRTAWDGGTWTPLGGGATNTPTPTFEGVTETDVNLSNPLVEAPVITTETTTSIFTFVNTRTRESGDKTTQIMNLPPATPVGKLIIINNSANPLNVQFNPSAGENNIVSAYRGVMLIATADGWLNLSE